MSDAADSWVALNLAAEVKAGNSSAPCQVVALSEGGLVLLPNMKGQPGMALWVEIQDHNWPAPVSLPGILVQEGEYHGHYAWQVQFARLTPQATSAVLLLMGVDMDLRQADPDGGMVAGFECRANADVRIADAACAVQAEPVECVAERTAVPVAGSAEYPVGYDAARAAAAFGQYSGTGGDHKAERRRFDGIHRLAENDHAIA